MKYFSQYPNPPTWTTQLHPLFLTYPIHHSLYFSFSFSFLSRYAASVLWKGSSFKLQVRFRRLLSSSSYFSFYFALFFLRCVSGFKKNLKRPIQLRPQPHGTDVRIGLGCASPIISPISLRIGLCSATPLLFLAYHKYKIILANWVIVYVCGFSSFCWLFLVCLVNNVNTIKKWV